MGISRNSSEKDVRKHYVVKDEISLLYNSDAHFLHQIGTVFSIFNMKDISFLEVKMALNQRDNRFVKIV